MIRLHINSDKSTGSLAQVAVERGGRGRQAAKTWGSGTGGGGAFCWTESLLTEVSSILGWWEEEEEATHWTALAYLLLIGVCQMGRYVDAFFTQQQN